jgi:hypothetical protein
MSRPVEHREIRKGVCACGAKFRKQTDLKQHLRRQQPEREVWINTAHPMNPDNYRPR